jgi:hypothetical protein
MISGAKTSDLINCRLPVTIPLRAAASLMIWREDRGHDEEQER